MLKTDIYSAIKSEDSEALDTEFVHLVQSFITSQTIHCLCSRSKVKVMGQSQGYGTE